MKAIGKCKICGGKIIQAGNGNIFCEDCADRDFGQRLQEQYDWKQKIKKQNANTTEKEAAIS